MTRIDSGKARIVGSAWVGQRVDLSGSALALEDRARGGRVVDDKREHRPVAPAAEEKVAEDVDARVGQGPGKRGHPARPVRDLGEDRFALDVRVATLVENGLRG